MMNAIKIRNLTKKFKDFTAVNKISLDVKEGEIFAFLGPNGAGKTTTIKIMTTLLQPTRGEVRLNGIDGLRGTLSASSHFGMFLDFTVLGGVTLILLAIGSYLFSKIQI